MSEDQRPRGRFGLPRLTDIGPMVSHHNTPETDCDKAVCFGGHTKEEVFRSIKDSFLSHKEEFENSLRDNGIPAEEIVISGSVVTGDFGCRDLSKATRELEEVSEHIWAESPDFPRNAVDVARTASRTADNTREVWEEGKRGLKGMDNEEILIEDLRIAVCSDIDVFVLVPDELVRNVRTEWNKHPIPQVREEFTSKMFNDTVGEMVYIDNLESADFIEENTLFTEEGFNEIIRRHYNG